MLKNRGMGNTTMSERTAGVNSHAGFRMGKARTQTHFRNTTQHSCFCIALHSKGNSNVSSLSKALIHVT